MKLTLRKLIMRSPFAKSAYEHATRSSAYGDDMSDRIHIAEFQPLAGASVVIFANTSKTDKVSDARTLRLMEERESIGCAVQSLGGKWISTLDSGKETITHAIWIEDSVDDNDEKQTLHVFGQSSYLSPETVEKLNTCISRDIPVVSPNWLISIGDLVPGQHWSEVDVEEHIPRPIKYFYDNNIGHNVHSSLHTSNSVRNSRRDATTSLSASIGETYKSLVDENPDLIEEEALNRAIELSMLDFAIVRHTPTKKFGHIETPNNNKKESPYEVLQVEESASATEIKNAYKRRALETHPDKGGKPGEFEAVARAYRKLLNATNSDGLDTNTAISLKTTAHWDAELKDHMNLVRELYQSHGSDIQDNLRRQNFALAQLNLTQKEAGSQNRNEKDELIRNSCFYLSLASSYLSGCGALAVWDKHSKDMEINDSDKSLLQEADDELIKETALQLKRVIEAAVLQSHPEWAAKGMVGEEVQAFSDFLVYILESHTIISDWAVCVFDTSSGFVDVYKGQNYKEEEDGANETYAASNTLTLRFVPGHYQPLLAATTDSARPSLKQILSVLNDCGVLYVITDGAAPE